MKDEDLKSVRYAKLSLKKIYDYFQLKHNIQYLGLFTLVSFLIGLKVCSTMPMI